MPRSRRGGTRQGIQGAQYSNRSDLIEKPRQPVRTATGQAYGQAGAQAAAQRAIPLPQQPSPQMGSAPPLPFDAPTQRPGEPVTAGLPIGAGPGPEVLGPMGDDTIILQLRALYQAYPNSDLRAIIEEFES